MLVILARLALQQVAAERVCAARIGSLLESGLGHDIAPRP